MCLAVGIELPLKLFFSDPMFDWPKLVYIFGAVCLQFLPQIYFIQDIGSEMH